MRTCGWYLELSVFFLVSFVFYLVSPFFFQPFLMSTSAPNERSMSNPLCYSSLGSVVTSDYVTPLTPSGHIVVSIFCVSSQCFVIEFCDLSFAQVGRLKKSTTHTFMVAELFPQTHPCPQNRLISALELLKESYENHRRNGNECQQGIKRPTKHSKMGTMPPLPLVSWRQGFHGTQKCVAGCFENMAMATTAETRKSLLSPIVGIGGMSSLTFCSIRTFGHRMNQSLHPARRVASQ